MSAALEFRGLACARAGRQLFSGLQLQLPPGRLLHVAGANGAGKTSLLRIVCGLLAPSRGSVCWRGRAVRPGDAQLSSALLYLGHAAALKDDLSCLENLSVACTLSGLVSTPAQRLQALADAGLARRESATAGRLSQGQRRRVALARLALAQALPLWVLDEPFNALDTAATAWLSSLIAGQLARGGVVVLTSHQGLGMAGGPEPVVLAL